MYLAVLKYGRTLNPPEGIPPDWPAEVREMADEDPLPNQNWIAMTLQEYAQLKADFQSQYNSWWGSNKHLFISNQPDPYAQE